MHKDEHSGAIVSIQFVPETELLETGLQDETSAPDSASSNASEVMALQPSQVTFIWADQKQSAEVFNAVINMFLHIS